MIEYDLIKTLASDFPRSNDQINEIFTCDAELVEIGGKIWGMSMDEFTPEEDLFYTEDNVLLGRNLVVCTLSDLFAAGVKPHFYMHTIAIPHVNGESFASKLVAGVRMVLDEVGCFLCGGDMSSATSWRYCGFAIGPVENRPVTRILPTGPQEIWVTGDLGDANIAAMQGESVPAFELRIKEAEFIREKATACIDTSGGFMDAIHMLSRVNPQSQFILDMQSFPYSPGVVETARELSLPNEAALLGGAGEYELLFTVADSTQVKGLCAKKVGVICEGDGGVYFSQNGNTTNQPVSPPPCPRSFVSRDEYIKAVLEAASALYG